MEVDYGSAIQLYGAISAADCREKKKIRAEVDNGVTYTALGDLICDNSLTYTVAESGRITF